MPVATLTCNALPVEAEHFDSRSFTFNIINLSYFGSSTLDLLIIIFLKLYVLLDFIVTVTLMFQLDSDFTFLSSNLSNRFQLMDFWKTRNTDMNMA